MSNSLKNKKIVQIARYGDAAKMPDYLGGCALVHVGRHDMWGAGGQVLPNRRGDGFGWKLREERS